MKKFRTYDLFVELYRSCQALRLDRNLKDQLSRASSSIALNLSEGRAKRTFKDQRKFFYIAMGSLREVQTVFELAAESVPPELVALADRTAAHLYKLIQAMDKSAKEGS